MASKAIRRNGDGDDLLLFAFVAGAVLYVAGQIQLPNPVAAAKSAIGSIGQPNPNGSPNLASYVFNPPSIPSMDLCSLIATWQSIAPSGLLGTGLFAKDPTDWGSFRVWLINIKGSGADPGPTAPSCFYSNLGVTPLGSSGAFT